MKDISEILCRVRDVRGSLVKIAILKEHVGNMLLRDVIKATYEPHWVYNVKKLDVSDLAPSGGWFHEDDAWQRFLDTLGRCRRGELRGDDARNAICYAIEDAHPDQVQPWMLRVVARHLAVGCSTKTFNKVWPGLISTFECQLAATFDKKRISDVDVVAVEPKLDGARLLAFVRGREGTCSMFTRSGKRITNFDETVGCELLRLVGADDLVFDGEIMADDFSATMGQLFRNEGDPSRSFFNVFDVVPIDAWNNRIDTASCQERREQLEDMCINTSCMWVRLIERRIVAVDEIRSAHEYYVADGLEGTMIKRLDAPYRWKRTHDVMKLKSWLDFDLKIVSFNEGTGTYEGHLGSFVVDYDGIRVKIERGNMTKDQARDVWQNRSKYRGKIIEVQAQEITRDGSLRFPKFVRFRPDKDDS